MNKSNFRIISIFIILAFAIILYRLHSNANKMKEKYENSYIEYMEGINKLNVKFAAIEIYGDLFSPEFNSSVTFSELGASEPIVIYRIPVLGCTNCINEQLQTFSELADSINVKFCLVSNDEEIRSITNYRRVAQFDKDIYNCQDVIPDLDRNSMTYVFLLYRNTIQSIHVPNLSFPQASINYLTTIKQRISSNGSQYY